VQARADDVRDERLAMFGAEDHMDEHFGQGLSGDNFAIEPK
jgi:hypothetical protein